MNTKPITNGKNNTDHQEINSDFLMTPKFSDISSQIENVRQFLDCFNTLYNEKSRRFATLEEIESCLEDED